MEEVIERYKDEVKVEVKSHSVYKPPILISIRRSQSQPQAYPQPY
jgi:hypothetical protein